MNLRPFLDGGEIDAGVLPVSRCCVLLRVPRMGASRVKILENQRLGLLFAHVGPAGLSFEAQAALVKIGAVLALFAAVVLASNAATFRPEQAGKFTLEGEMRPMLLRRMD